MLRNPFHHDEDPEIVRALIREFPWAIIISTHDGTMVASHYPCCSTRIQRTSRS